MSRWVDWHIRLQKLNQQAVLEAQSMMEELTKETMISSGKVINNHCDIFKTLFYFVGWPKPFL